MAGIWDSPTEIDNGWKQFDWFGWIHESESGWVYHPEHGWLHAVGETEESVWFYDTEMGWAWTSKSIFPHYYLPATGDWLSYDGGNRDLRIFYRVATSDQIEIHRKNPVAPTRVADTYGWRHREFTETAEHELIGWTRNVVTTEFETQIIENDLIRVTLLPGWGARILSIFYKPRNMELLSYAKGDKFSDIIYAPGAFYYDDWLLLPGGINPTFPEGEHGKYWGEPWIFQSIEETNTAVTVRMSRTDDIHWAGRPGKFDNGLTGMTVDMDITIYRNRACVEITYTLTNNKTETIPYEFWMAAALAPLPPDQTATSSNLEIVMEQEKIALRDWWNWMKTVETDDSLPSDDVYQFDKLAWLYNWQGSGIAYAWPDTDNGWWGVINHDYNWGVLRTIDDPSDSPGMKIWGEGADYGMFELWSGNSQEFFVDAYLAPLEVKTWKEYFIPTVDLAEITFANQNGAAEAEVIIGSYTGYIDLSVFSTWQPANWRLDVRAIPDQGDPVPLVSGILNFTPAEPTQSGMLPFLMESLPATGTLRVEAILTDLFSGEERMRFDLDF
ncbi:DUF5107 domain-containing protein [Puniceicoccales bacterium CK1056]|uniref:DUF5107 domain-containing protein n=1 Tax=Oceanipulchritudo coccoides TaxID=2706888 RepID=A0A6B2M2I7_9BACT|nr:DUF5107 domain-containing protein [Oceanipulchritudo coccoides]NDV62015.1 DUF5107 domain-containing protein [Oceanipulchritudo coccoides]